MTETPIAQPEPEDDKPRSGLLSDPGHIREDCKLIARYGVHESHRDAMVATLLRIMQTTTHDRERIRAVEALARLDRMNAEVTKLDIVQKHLGDTPTDAVKDKASMMMEQLRAMQESVPKHHLSEVKPSSNGNGKPHSNGKVEAAKKSLGAE
jgi:uncharacterized membrane protein